MWKGRQENDLGNWGQAGYPIKLYTTNCLPEFQLSPWVSSVLGGSSCDKARIAIKSLSLHSMSTLLVGQAPPCYLRHSPQEVVQLSFSGSKKTRSSEQLSAEGK